MTQAVATTFQPKKTVVVLGGIRSPKNSLRLVRCVVPGLHVPNGAMARRNRTPSLMEAHVLDPMECDRARLARDAAYDGRCLHGRANHGRLLPSGMSGAAGAIAQRALLSIGGSSRGRWVPAMFALPSRDGAILARLEWLTHDRRARTAG